MTDEKQRLAEKYPEHAKLGAIAVESQKLGEFLEWLQMNKYLICTYVPGSDHPVPVNKTIYTLLAEYYGINLRKLDAEKMHMLDVIRAANQEGDHA